MGHEPTELDAALRAIAQRKAVTITVCPDGPYLVRGHVTLTGEHGSPVERQRPTMALCRCGRSRTKPLCDGSHKWGQTATFPRSPA